MANKKSSAARKIQPKNFQKEELEDTKSEAVDTLSEDTVSDGEKTVVASDTFKVRMREAGNVPPSFVLVLGPIDQMGKQWFITKPQYVIGRSPECDVFVDDRSVSKTHAQILLAGQKVSLTDLGSTNGTELGGERLQANKPTPLKNNDLVKLGNVLFKFLERGNIEAATHQKTFDRTQMDSLTEIFNKAAYLTKADEFFKRARMTETPLSVVVFDIDDFKKVNDTHGHLAGDFILKELASVVQNNLIRQNDFFARFGGEEFVLLMSGCPLKRAVEIAERVRNTIEKHIFVFEEKILPMTISVGVATLEADMTSAQMLFEKADQACYVSKRAGKNRVSTI